MEINIRDKGGVTMQAESYGQSIIFTINHSSNPAEWFELSREDAKKLVEGIKKFYDV